MRLTRRNLLVAGGAGAGLVVAFFAWPRAPGSVLSAAKGEQLFGHYVKVATDGRVIIAIPQAETGQGIWTGLAQIAADALGADWGQVAVEPAPYGPVYSNDLLGLRATAGATSARAIGPALKEAAETARSLLVRAAAARWGVDADECNVGGGMVRHGNRVLSFGELAEDAAKLGPSGAAGRLDARLLAKPLPRLDSPAKVDGRLRFAADVRLPGLLYASARLVPPRGRLISDNRDRAARVPGVKQVFASDAWIAAIATNWWIAEQAMKIADPHYQGPDVDDRSIWAALDSAIDEGQAERLAEQGDFTDAVGQAYAFGATYRIAPALHQGLEPLTATARFNGGRLEVWAPVQAYDAAVAMAAKAGGVGAGSVILYPMPVGDPSGRALEPDAIPIAVALAKHANAPVQLVIPHSQCTNQDCVRPPMVARMAAMPAPDGTLTGWSAKFATAPGLGAALARLSGGNAPKVELPGAAPPYGIPNLRVDAVAAKLPIKCGYMRGGTEALTSFATESFIDEMARRLDREPLAFRIAMLSGNPRLATVLSRAAELSKWDGGSSGMGIACASAFGSHIALVTRAGMNDGRIEVERLVAAVDCGQVINPVLLRQQVEGSLLQALALATMAAPTYVAGMPVARNLTKSGARPAMQCPQVAIEIVNSNNKLGGVSGLGHLVLAPSLANALASATGQRLRNLPFDLTSA